MWRVEGRAVTENVDEGKAIGCEGFEKQEAEQISDRF